MDVTGEPLSGSWTGYVTRRSSSISSTPASTPASRSASGSSATGLRPAGSNSEDCRSPPPSNQQGSNAHGRRGLSEYKSAPQTVHLVHTLRLGKLTKKSVIHLSETDQTDPTWQGFEARWIRLFSTIIADIEDYQNHSQPASEMAQNSSESSESEADVPSTSGYIDHGLASDWIMSFDISQILRPKLPK